MPLHKSSRASRLDPTMISAPLGDFRHTMHIGRGGDAFGDTSFLSTLGPSPASTDQGSPGNIPDVDPDDLHTDGPGGPPNDEPQHSESVSSLTLELDLDLGPSMLGDVLGVMDGLALEQDVFSPKSDTSLMETKQGKGVTGTSANMENELNGKNLVGLDGDQLGDSRIPGGSSVKQKGLKPKVRFSDKREEIIHQSVEDEESQELDLQEDNQLVSSSPTRDEVERGERGVEEGEAVVTNHQMDFPPSPASSHSSDGDEAIPLDRRRMDSCHSETDSEEEEEEGETGRGYTFEDEFDDEIGL
ncbi:cdc42 effector protein 5 [Cynoglossus semilaevis]|uniref:cdc42 effector protein 5 n=1 Tax=Cynoglossus semilaevis TaxID=244447 RepID=UPI000496A7BF|nr:uncharacterized protein LOC103387847 [Cynoglossus semilaevis]